MIDHCSIQRMWVGNRLTENSSSLAVKDSWNLGNFAALHEISLATLQAIVCSLYRSNICNLLPGPGSSFSCSFWGFLQKKAHYELIAINFVILESKRLYLAQLFIT